MYIAEFFENPENFADKCHFQDEEGNPCVKDKAVKLDLLGAVRKFYPHKYREIVGKIQNRIGKRSISLWYDINSVQTIQELCKELEI